MQQAFLIIGLKKSQQHKKENVSTLSLKYSVLKDDSGSPEYSVLKDDSDSSEL